ncbi:MAG TPA: SPOR domain-containing protein [Rhizomicrobium sp.]|nr:SPOR domain-containing protein [Rhizomicrobium sp.]
MANYERHGVYEPNEDVRVYDGSEDDEDVEGSRLPLLIVLALLVLAMFAGVVWLAYTQGVARGRGETPVLTAAAGPERVAPQQPGGANVPYQGFKIYEQPAPPDDAAEAPAAAPPAHAAPQPQSPPQPKEAASQPPPAAPAAKAAPPPAQQAAAAPKPAAPAAKPAPAPAVPAPKSMAALIQQANSAPPAKPAASSPAKPAPANTVATAGPRPLSGPGAGAPRQLGLPMSAPAQTAATKPAAGTGSYVLQIGAYKSQAEADAAWKAYKTRHAALLSGYGPDVQQADLGEKGTWYRLRVAGFSNREVAVALCERLKADGGGCFLGK